MASRFRQIRTRIAPRWLTEGEGGDIGYALDIVKDAFIERLRLGLLARFPENGPNGETAPEDALQLMGRDRRVVRGLGESAVSYAARQKLWLDDRQRQGNPFMLMQKIAEYVGLESGLAYRTVDARGNWYSRDENGVETSLLKQENWDWSGEPIGERWSRFWVIIYPNGLWVANADDWGTTTWAAPKWGAPTDNTWGTTADRSVVSTIQGIVSDWMPAGTRCINIIIALDSNSFDPTAPEPDGLWEGYSKNVAGVQVRARLSTARYWAGVTR
jgi:hypothetical protein